MGVSHAFDPNRLGATAAGSLWWAKQNATEQRALGHQWGLPKERIQNQSRKNESRIHGNEICRREGDAHSLLGKGHNSIWKPSTSVSSRKKQGPQPGLPRKGHGRIDSFHLWSSQKLFPNFIISKDSSIDIPPQWSSTGFRMNWKQSADNWALRRNSWDGSRARQRLSRGAGSSGAL